MTVQFQADVGRQLGQEHAAVAHFGARPAQGLAYEAAPLVRDAHLVTRVVNRAVICALGHSVGDGPGRLGFMSTQAPYKLIVISGQAGAAPLRGIRLAQRRGRPR